MQQSVESLTQMLCSPVGVEMGSLWKAPESLSASVGLRDARGTGISLKISGDIDGSFLLYLPDDSSCWLVQQLLGVSATNVSLSEIACSALKETGNIIASSLLSVLKNQFGINCLPTPPLLQQWLMLDGFSLKRDVVVETPFFGQEKPFVLRGSIYLFAKVETVAALINRK
jgi:chemotaxis protein CheY-P-specific phosphatase CheC